jgi:hypothetical protein
MSNGQRLFESEDDYRDRISREANERDIERASGDNHVALFVTSVEVSARFYGETIGFPVLAKPALDFPGANPTG